MTYIYIPCLVDGSKVPFESRPGWISFDMRHLFFTKGAYHAEVTAIMYVIDLTIEMEQSIATFGLSI